MEEEREIDLKQLFLVVCLHYRLIAVVCAVCLVAGLAYGVLVKPAPDVSVQEEELDEESQEVVETYLTGKRYYEVQKKSLENQIAEINELLAGRMKYMEESPAIQIDPYKVYHSFTEIYVIRDDDRMELSPDGTFVLPTETLRILYVYNMLVNREINSDTYLRTARKLKTEPKYLSEMIGCGRDEKNAVIAVTTYGADANYTETLMDAVLEQIQEAQPAIARKYGEHRLVVERHEPSVYGVTGYLKKQQDELVSVTDYTNRLTAAATALDKLEEPEAPTGIEVVDDGDPESDEAVLYVDTGVNIKRLLKFGLLGLFGGLFLPMFLIALYYILTNRVLSADEFNARYRTRAITVLAGRKETGIRRRLMEFGRDTAYLKMPEEEQYAVAAANLSVYAPEVKDILLTGSIDTPRLTKLAEALEQRVSGVKFAVASHINEDASALAKLKEHTHVIMVGECLASGYEEADRAFRTLRDWNKEVIGTIVLG